ncbi:MAG: D-lysine 5,6-aminomutase subunit alpha [Deltaproteobacteria bacterium]|nr:D-lysine 5,6-aminomutase subunit alpha [Deltaproteobacteria bacterium]
MNKLNLDHDKINEARNLAENITGPVLRYVDYHSTVSIERTVLRLFGVQGYGTHLPLVNEIVDTLDKPKLARGIAYWFCLGLFHHPKLSVQELAQAVAEKKIRLGELAEAPRDKVELIAKNLAHQALKKIKDRANKRAQLKSKFRSNIQGPLKYIIIATGNIHEDVVNAKASAEMGADIIAVIRSTAQSLLDFVPEGATTEGFGGTFATQKNFQIMREALNDSTHKLKRYIGLTNYSSGLCMPEIAAMGALEGLDYLLNDSMYGILFRDINMKRTFTDQYFSRQICAAADITIMTGEDNYLTTAESFHYWFQVLSSQLLNESFAKRAGMREHQLALGHAFEMDPDFEDNIAHEIAQAQLVRELFPHSPIKFMPPTKHKTGDIFSANLYDGLFNLAGAMTGQSIQLLGMMTEAIHNPYLMDRFVGLKNANYIFKGASALADEVEFKPNGKIVRRARQMLDQALILLKKVEKLGLMQSIEQGLFAHMERAKEGGKGLEGVFQKDRSYFNPFFEKKKEHARGNEAEDLRRLAQEEKERRN